MNDAPRVSAFLLLTALAVRPHLSGAVYPFADGILLVAVLLALGLAILTDRTEAFPRRPLVPALALPWILVAWAMTGLLWSPDPGQGVRECASLVLGVCVFTLAAIVSRNKDGLSSVSGVLLAAVSAPVLLRSLYQGYFGLSSLRGSIERMAEQGQDVDGLLGVIAQERVFAGFLNPNMLAGFLAILLPFTLDLFLASRGRRRFVLALMLAGEAWVLVLTGSGAGVLAAFAAVLGVLWMRGLLSRKVLAAAVLSAALMAGLVLVLRGVSFLSGPENSIAQRIGYAAAGLRMALVHPLLGWGAGSSPGALMGFVAERIRPVADPHNFLLRSWIGWGAPGVGILALFAASWFAGVKGGTRSKGWKGLPDGTVGLFWGGAAFLLHSLADMDFFVPEVSFFGWGALGAALGSAAPALDGMSPTVDEAGRAPNGSTTGGWRLAAGATALFLVLPSLVYLQAEFAAFRGGRGMQDGQFSQAAGFFRAARRALPFNGRFALDEGRALLAAGDPSSAIARFRVAASLMAASPYPAWELGRAALAAGEWEAASEHLNLALSRYPTSARIRIDLARAYLGLGDRARARGMLEEARRFTAFDPQASAFLDQALEGKAP